MHPKFRTKHEPWATVVGRTDRGSEEIGLPIGVRWGMTHRNMGRRRPWNCQKKRGPDVGCARRRGGETVAGIMPGDGDIGREAHGLAVDSVKSGTASGRLPRLCLCRADGCDRIDHGGCGQVRGARLAGDVGPGPAVRACRTVLATRFLETGRFQATGPRGCVASAPFRSALRTDQPGVFSECHPIRANLARRDLLRNLPAGCIAAGLGDEIGAAGPRAGSGASWPASRG